MTKNSDFTPGNSPPRASASQPNEKNPPTWGKSAFAGPLPPVATSSKCLLEVPDIVKEPATRVEAQNMSDEVDPPVDPPAQPAVGSPTAIKQEPNPLPEVGETPAREQVHTQYRPRRAGRRDHPDQSDYKPKGPQTNHCRVARSRRLTALLEVAAGLARDLE